MSDVIDNPMTDSDLNNETALRLGSPGYNLATRMKQLIHEEYNSAYNHAELVARIQSGNAIDLNEEPKKQGEPFFIIGSGPSLDDSIEHLREWRGGIVCSSSHALTLMYHGIEPDYIVALDPFSFWSEIQGVDWSKTKTKLVAHPGVMPELIKAWPNQILLYRQDIRQPDSFYATTQNHMYSRREGGRDDGKFHLFIRTTVILFASSPPAQLFIGLHLGYGTAYLAGVDFAFHSGKSRFTSYTVKQAARTVSPGNAGTIEIPAEWDRHESPFVEEETNKEAEQVVTTANGLKSHKVHLYYKKNFVSAWRLALCDMWTTDHGALTEVPYVDIKQVLRSQNKKHKPKTKEWITETTERYLATVGAYVLNTKQGGTIFVESEQPVHDLTEYMSRSNKLYHCVCGWSGQSPDDADHSRDKCQQCGNEIKRLNEYDVEANIERIMRIRKEVAKGKGKV
jgi:hypothetical protein